MISKNIEKEEIYVAKYIIIYKFILGLIELLLGLGIVFWGDKILVLYRHYKARELLENPHDLLISTTERLLPFILRHIDYIILFLVLLGLVKMIGAIGLYYRRHWGLDLLVAVTVFLLPFDIYGLFGHPTLLRFIYFAINMFIALYLVNFKPKHYFLKLTKRIRKK